MLAAALAVGHQPGPQPNGMPKSAARISQHLVALIDPLDPEVERFSKFGCAFDREQPRQTDARSKSRLNASSSRRCLRRCVPEIQPPRRAHRGGHPAHPSIRLLRHEHDFCAVVLSSRSRRRAQIATGEVPEKTTWLDGEASQRHGQDPNCAVALQLAHDEEALRRARLGACLGLREPGRPGRSRFRPLVTPPRPAPGEHCGACPPEVAPVPIRPDAARHRFPCRRQRRLRAFVGRRPVQGGDIQGISMGHPRPPCQRMATAPAKSPAWANPPSTTRSPSSRRCEWMARSKVTGIAAPNRFPH